ncbi:DUF4200 domain-containing protein [Mucilaginibacter rubeus]|uniref:BZIP transcription factor n=1 Tax=Mucilaginibacter rubeus TaxID=2027860 RepID=A0A5C1HU29_9SPHI|nr:DUF4200 domain-containing protein [Mucilaginibacter rubeus]QEM09135.1 hypothetical protein DEO27_003585 [Mucilaginibacter rubeus]
MKALTIVIFISFAFYTRLYAQNTFPASGNVGVGTNAPTAPLDVRGDIKWGPGSTGMLVSDVNGGIELGPVSSTGAVPYFDFHFGSGTSQDYNVRLQNSANNEFTIQTNSGGTVFAVTGSTVGIGTTDTKGYKLGVNGSMIATSVTVKLYGSWADYVFKPTYKLPSLSAVKSYIQQHRHLPEIPSAEEIEKDGLNVGEMNKLLMKKVEELTLYAIENEQKDKEKDKLLTTLQAQIDLLKEQLTAVQKEIKK